MRYTTKRALLDDIREAHRVLAAQLAAIPARRWREAGVWGDNWTVCDLVAHLSAWQRLFLGWYQAGLEGKVPSMPARGYKWNETPRLNRDIQLAHADRSRTAIERDFADGHRQMVELVDTLTEEQLLQPGQFQWTGHSSLTTYLGANTSSHYRFASKVIARWLRRTALR